MKSDVIQYERTYQRLKHKIECGILPVGTKLPGRAVLCREFGTSERTIRRALELLEQDGFLEIAPRKRPTVISAFASPAGRALQNMKPAEAAQVNDLMQTANLLCSPIYLRGLRLCASEDWHIPETILDNMDPNRPDEFWRIASRLWRFFIARNENELLLRVVDTKWMEHIDNMDELRKGIYLRSYGQRDPVVEYRFEGFNMFDEMVEAIREDTTRMLLTMELKTDEQPKREQVAKPTGEAGAGDAAPAKKQPVKKAVKIGRNDPCPCGSGLKWKKCTCAQYHPDQTPKA